MTTPSIQKTSVNLDGLLEILGKNLYSSPTVALRELIQNASDACERHRIETGESKGHRIDLICRPNEQQLVITDNGSGLTYDEIHDFLATIGSGYSRILRNKTQSEDIIGYFGLGFLSAYVVSNKVEVVTTSYQTPDQSWKFTSSGGKNYAITATEAAEVGTQVTLHLSDAFRTLAQARYVTELVERFCCLLDIPIHINSAPEPVNGLERPWDVDPNAPEVRKRKHAIAFAHVFETTFEPIATFLIPNDNPFGLKGLLWVQGSSSFASTDNRNVSIFVRNMFITDEDKDLLPRWAGFCGGVLESTRFLPTASRESLQKNQYYLDVATYLRDFLADSLRRLVEEEPATWRRILSRHNEALLGAAVSDDRLFETTCESLKVPTTDGYLTLPEVLSQSRNTIYIKPAAETGHEEVLFRARGNPLVQGYLFGAMAFCQKFNILVGGGLEILGTQSSRESVFPKLAPASPEVSALLEELFASDQHAVAFTRFEPAHIPLIAMEDAEIVTKKRIEDDEADARIGSAVLGLARLHTQAKEETRERTIFVNLDNPLIQRLPELSPVRREQLRNLMVSLMEFLCLDSSKLDQGLDKVFETFNTMMGSFLLEGSD